MKTRFRSLLTLTSVLAFLLTYGAHDLRASGSESIESEEEDTREEKVRKAELHYNKGVEHMEQAREEAAVHDSTYNYNYRATANKRAMREYEKAVAQFKDAIEHQPKMARAHNNLAYCYRKLGVLEKSLEHYQKALDIDSTFAQAREYLGETYLALGKLDKAKEQHDWLVANESEYADTLAKSIELYKLKGVDEKIKEAQDD